MTNAFTLEYGIEVQRQNLKEWETKLNNKCFNDLIVYVLKENSKLNDKSTGFDVVRGQQLVEFVSNWKETK